MRLPDFLPAGLANPQKGGCQKSAKVARETMAEGGKNHQFVVYLERPLKRPSRHSQYVYGAGCKRPAQATWRNRLKKKYNFCHFLFNLQDHRFFDFN